MRDPAGPAPPQCDGGKQRDGYRNCEYQRVEKAHWLSVRILSKLCNKLGVLSLSGSHPLLPKLTGEEISS